MSVFFGDLQRSLNSENQSETGSQQKNISVKLRAILGFTRIHRMVLLNLVRLKTFLKLYLPF